MLKNLGKLRPTHLMTHSLASGIAGVVQDVQIPVRPYLVFVTTQASLLVKKANEILSTTRNTSQ